MTDQFCILIHYHEISLKGKNRSWFERHLIKNIKRQLTNLPLTKIQLNAARVFCFGIDQHRWDEYAYRINKIMGIKHATMMENFVQIFLYLQILTGQQLVISLLLTKF